MPKEGAWGGAMAEELLAVRGLRVLFPGPAGPTAVVDGLDLTVPAGGVVALVGESGSGKTMTALAILRLVPPPGRIAQGAIVYDGRDLLKLDDAAMRALRGREIAMIFQEPKSALNPVYRIGDQIAEAVRVHQRVSAQAAWARAAELLGLMGMPDPKRQRFAYPHELSGGMRQRALMAMALAAEPRLVLADEPTSALDVTVQAEILERLSELRAKTGMAVLWITHDLGLVAEWAESLVVLYRGQAMEVGDVRTTLLRPLHPYTEELLAAARGLGPAGRRPNLEAGGDGCIFRWRCPYARTVCQNVEGLVEAEVGRLVRCVVPPAERSASREALG